MKLRKKYNWGLALVAGVLTSLIALPYASAELLYDEDISPQQQQPGTTSTAPANAADSQRIEERSDLRQALGASNRASTTVQAQPMSAPAPVQILQPENTQVSISQAAASSTTSSAADTEVQNLSKAELMRRERVREEVKNEDILQERLEELRLRDERRRTDDLLGAKAQTTVAQGNAVMTEEVVTAPVTERNGQPAAPVVRQPVVYSNEPAPAATLTATADASDEDKTKLWIQPRAGISQMTAKDYFEVVPHYSAGIAAGAEVSDNLGFELGYQFNEYGVKTSSTYQYAYPGFNYETHAMKQNVFEGGLKLFFLDSSAKLRPFVGLGAAYTLSYVNYPETMLNYYRMAGRMDMAKDFESTSYVGSLSTGFDVRVSKSISVGATFKYYRVLSAHENEDLASGYYGYGAMPTALADPQKDFIGNSLSVSSFYSILAGATFNF